MVKIQVIDRNKKKDAQILQDISMTPAERFKRMFDLIEFCIIFSKAPQLPFDNADEPFFILKRKDEIYP